MALPGRAPEPRDAGAPGERDDVAHPVVVDVEERGVGPPLEHDLVADEGREHAFPDRLPGRSAGRRPSSAADGKEEKRREDRADGSDRGHGGLPVLGESPAPDRRRTPGRAGERRPDLPAPLRYLRGKPEAKEIGPGKAGCVPPWSQRGGEPEDPVVAPERPAPAVPVARRQVDLASRTHEDVAQPPEVAREEGLARDGPADRPRRAGCGRGRLRGARPPGCPPPSWRPDRRRRGPRRRSRRSATTPRGARRRRSPRTRPPRAHRRTPRPPATRSCGPARSGSARLRPRPRARSSRASPPDGRRGPGGSCGRGSRSGRRRGCPARVRRPRRVSGSSRSANPRPARRAGRPRPPIVM